MKISTPTPTDKNAFICPHCGVYAQMVWTDCTKSEYIPIYRGFHFSIAKCAKCGEVSIWNFDKMIYPTESTAPLPNINMPENVKELYNEARDIVNKSPRGAAALLRLALDKLCDEVCEDCKNVTKIDNKIRILVANGLSSKLQKVFDFVRVTGNDAVHDLGIINIQDNPEIADALFGLLNFIVEKMITENNQIDDLYNLIPQKKRDEIEKRNNNAKEATINNAK